ncbi:MAG: type II toxin-antitoxin system VapC family toxin [Rhodomicrobium sp.]
MIVLDASALLALVQREPGGSKVHAVLRTSVVSAVNFTEVSNKLYDKMGVAQGSLTAAQLASLIKEIAPYTFGETHAASVIHATNRHLGISLGDCICLALGRKLGADVWTCDRKWAQLDASYRVTVIR